MKLKDLAEVLNSNGIEVDRVPGDDLYGRGTIYLKNGYRLELQKDGDLSTATPTIKSLIKHLRKRKVADLYSITKYVFNEDFNPCSHPSRIYSCVSRARKYVNIRNHGYGKYSLEEDTHEKKKVLKVRKDEVSERIPSEDTGV